MLILSDAEWQRRRAAVHAFYEKEALLRQVKAQRAGREQGFIEGLIVAGLVLWVIGYIAGRLDGA